MTKNQTPNYFTENYYNFTFCHEIIILLRKNVGYASTSNSAGLPIGMFIGSVCFTLLVSEQFGKKYFKIESDKGGLVTMKST